MPDGPAPEREGDADQRQRGNGGAGDRPPVPQDQQEQWQDQGELRLVDEATQEQEGIGRFGWATDPEGNRFELWEPAEGM